MQGKRIAVLGAGNMGTALLRGVLAAKWGRAKNCIATNPGTRKLDALKKELGVQTTKDNRKATAQADVVILAVKPQILDNVLEEIAPAATADKLFVSIAAGATTTHIEELLGAVPVVRSMPNVAVTVREGATAICPGTHAKRVHLDLSRTLFEAVGRVVEVPENLMDAVTGLSGTGPMYIFQIIEGLSDAGVKVGLSRAVASTLAIQTVVGAGRMAQDSGIHPGQLKDLVTSPGGTAITALHSLERNRLRAILMDAVEAATDRSAELGAIHHPKAEKRLPERERVA
ncbi:MAG: pyrroline-5-carboxylate reductase [Euryarchaeota archaeon]|nr:pyrroline-5-carboxylate reductase [Euryarchaeota archaeon]